MADLAALREAFPPETVGKLPKITCQTCSKSNTKSCEQHKKDRCGVCGNWITKAHVDLDFVGHAAVTNRLLNVDPEWTWEPLSLDANGLPAYDNSGGLWIRLTVCGVTRLGYGDGPDPKQRIGDALRNAAMRFGVALELWSKNELEHAEQNAGAASDLTAPPAPDTSSSGNDSSDDPHPAKTSGPPVVPAGATAPTPAGGEGADVADRASAPDPLDRIQGIEGVNKRIKNLSPEKRQMWSERKPSPGATFVAEALTLLDELDAVTV